MVRDGSTAIATVVFGGQEGTVIISSRIFFCNDSGQCAMENVSFVVPIRIATDKTQDNTTIDYKYNFSMPL